MVKRKIDIELYSYGEYSRWDRESRDIPRLINIAETIPATIGTEFGYVLKIKRGKGEKLTFQIMP